MNRTKVIKCLASILAPWFDLVVMQFCPEEPQENNVLIIRLDAIGDFVLWLSAAKALLEYYKKQGKHVTLLGNKAWSGWAQQLGIADEIWALEPGRFMKQPSYRASWLRRVRRTGFDIIVHPIFSREFLTGDAIVRASRARERIGFAGDAANTAQFFKRWSDRWYTRLIKADALPQMELQRHAEFMRGLTGGSFTATVPVLGPIHTSVATPSSRYVVLFPAASWRGRMWPADRFVEIGIRLASTGRTVVVAGGPADRLFCDPVCKGLGEKAVDMVAKTSLAELAELLRGADLVLTNETSAVHIGAAVNTPVLCILGGGHYGRFAPYDIDDKNSARRLPAIACSPMPCFHCNWQCIYPRTDEAPVRCIENIDTEQVWQQCQAMLA